MSAAQAYLIGPLTLPVAALWIGSVWYLIHFAAKRPYWERQWCAHHGCRWKQVRSDHPRWPWWLWRIKEWRDHPRPCPHRPEARP